MQANRLLAFFHLNMLHQILFHCERQRQHLLSKCSLKIYQHKQHHILIDSDLKPLLSQILSRMASSGMLRHVALVRTDV
jgi:hypothetical protein